MKHTTIPRIVQELINARARVAKGWCQRSFENSCGDVCALGALGSAKYGSISIDYLSWALREKAQAFNSIVEYNDSSNRTKADIIDLYDRAIALAIANEFAS